MDEREWLAERFEEDRPRLRSVAYRMLGSFSDADDAVQDTWLRLSRAGTEGVDNLGGWLTTILARVCLNMLRARTTRREDSLEVRLPDPVVTAEGELQPEEEALLADSVGLALLVVLDTLTPAERLAFVLHDIFALPFDQIAPIVERSEAATRQLASRARRRVRGGAVVHAADLALQREVVDAFLAASREGSFDRLLALLDPDIVFRADRAAVSGGASQEVRGAEAVARQFVGRARGARPALVDGAVGVIVRQQGRLFLVINLTINNGKIAAIEAVADPAHLRRVHVSVLGEGAGG